MFNLINFGTAFSLAKIQEDFMLSSRKPWNNYGIDRKSTKITSVFVSRYQKEGSIPRRISSS